MSSVMIAAPFVVIHARSFFGRTVCWLTSNFLFCLVWSRHVSSSNSHTNMKLVTYLSFLINLNLALGFAFHAAFSTRVHQSTLTVELMTCNSHHTRHSHLSHSKDDTATSSQNDEQPYNAITDEIEQLQQQLTYIQALEERNKAQLDSFIDEQDQWNSMESHERQLLETKGDIEKKLEQMTSELVTIWMGGKSMEG